MTVAGGGAGGGPSVRSQPIQRGVRTSRWKNKKANVSKLLNSCVVWNQNLNPVLNPVNNLSVKLVWTHRTEPSQTFSRVLRPTFFLSFLSPPSISFPPLFSSSSPFSSLLPFLAHLLLLLCFHLLFHNLFFVLLPYSLISFPPPPPLFIIFFTPLLFYFSLFVPSFPLLLHLYPPPFLSFSPLLSPSPLLGSYPSFRSVSSEVHPLLPPLLLLPLLLLVTSPCRL